MQYHKELDSLRGIASFAVIAFHSGLSIFSGGFFAVDVFFVISGYLIATNITTNNPDFSTFIFKRISRLFPLLALVTVSALIVQYLAWGTGPRIQHFFVPLFAGNLFQQFGLTTSILGHTWSLGAEMQFYIAIFIILKISPTQYRLLIFLLIYFGIFLFRNEIASAFPTKQTFEILYNNPASRFTGFTAGVIIALINVQRVHTAFLLLAILVLSFCLSTARFYRLDVFIDYIPFVEISSFIIVLSLVTQSSTWLSKLLSLKYLVYTGQLSYGIYLWHYPIVRLLREDFNKITIFICATILSFILAHLSFRYFERPASRAMNTFLMSRKSN